MERLSRYIPLSLAILWMASSCTAFDPHNVQIGKCPKVESVEGFRVKDFAGEWFVGYNFGDKLTACTSLMVTMGSEAGYYDVQTTTRISYEKAMEARATLAPRSTENKALMSWSWNAFPAIVDQVTVVSTDYANYTTLYFCSDMGLFHINNAVVLTRTKEELASETIKEAQDQLRKFFTYVWGSEVRKCYIYVPRSYASYDSSNRYNPYGYSGSRSTTTTTTPAPSTFSVDTIIDSVSHSFKVFLEMF